MDFDHLFEGLPDNKCQCPHWGYIIQGRVLMKYADGSEEEMGAGEVYYAPGGHTAEILEDCVTIDISPMTQWRELAQHLAARIPTV